MGPISPKNVAASAHPKLPAVTVPKGDQRFHLVFQRLSSPSVPLAVHQPPLGNRAPASKKDARPEEDAARSVGSGGAPAASPIVLGGIAPPLMPSCAPPDSHPVRAAMSMEQLLPDLVKRIAWGGDARRATVRLEIGRGALDGAEITVHADGGRVTVELAGSTSNALHAFRERVDERLRGRGINVDEIRVV